MKRTCTKISIGNYSYGFKYDNNGNMTEGYDFSSSTSTNPVKRNIDCNVDNMPVKITRGVVATTITYDGRGSRIKKDGSAGTTYYIGAHYEIENGVNTRYVIAGGQRIAKLLPRWLNS